MFTSTPFRFLADRGPVSMRPRRDLVASATEVLERALEPHQRPELWVCLEARDQVVAGRELMVEAAARGVAVHVFGVPATLAGLRLAWPTTAPAYLHPVSLGSRLSHEWDVLLLTRDAGWGMVSHEDGQEYADEADRRFGHLLTDSRAEVAQAVSWLREHLVLAAA